MHRFRVPLSPLESIVCVKRDECAYWKFHWWLRERERPCPAARLWSRRRMVGEKSHESIAEDDRTVARYEEPLRMERDKAYTNKEPRPPVPVFYLCPGCLQRKLYMASVLRRDIDNKLYARHSALRTPNLVHSRLNLPSIGYGFSITHTRSTPPPLLV
jgi:hypothetical protein